MLTSYERGRFVQRSVETRGQGGSRDREVKQKGEKKGQRKEERKMEKRERRRIGVYLLDCETVLFFFSHFMNSIPPLIEGG